MVLYLGLSSFPIWRPFFLNRLLPIHGSDGEDSACYVEDLGLIPGLGKSPGDWQPTPVFSSGEFHGQRSLVGCSQLWGHKESDTTE